jgi:hypothetical protein
MIFTSAHASFASQLIAVQGVYDEDGACIVAGSWSDGTMSFSSPTVYVCGAPGLDRGRIGGRSRRDPMSTDRVAGSEFGAKLGSGIAPELLHDEAGVRMTTAGAFTSNRSKARKRASSWLPVATTARTSMIPRA